LPKTPQGFKPATNILRRFYCIWASGQPSATIDHINTGFQVSQVPLGTIDQINAGFQVRLPPGTIDQISAGFQVHRSSSSSKAATLSTITIISDDYPPKFSSAGEEPQLWYLAEPIKCRQRSKTNNRVVGFRRSRHLIQCHQRSKINKSKCRFWRK
jgi:hypothetical protein